MNIKTINDLNPSNKRYVKPVICIVGANGQLGKEFYNYLTKIEYKNFVGFDSSLDITNKDSIKTLKFVSCNDDMRAVDVIINCAAYNNVYAPEDNEKEKNKCFKTNALGPKYLAEFCNKEKIKLIHFSTNYVFEDSRRTMKSYTEFDTINPFLFYGFSKLCGEKFIKECIPGNSIILRTAWLFSKKGALIKMIEDYEKSKDILKIAGAIGNPTYTLDLVKQTLFLIENEANGLYNCVNAGNTTKKQYIDKTIELINSKVETETKCVGPSMPLNHFMLKMENLNIMRPWEDAIEDCFNGENI